MRRVLIYLFGGCLVAGLSVVSRGQQMLYAPGEPVLELLFSRADELKSNLKEKPTGRYAMAAVDGGSQIAILDTKEGFLRFVRVPTPSSPSEKRIQEITADIETDLFDEFTNLWRNGEIKGWHKTKQDTLMVIDIWAKKLARCR